MRSRLAVVDAAQALRAGECAAAHLVASPLWRDAGVVLVYSAVRGELDPRPLAEAAWAEGKRVCLPNPAPERRDLAPVLWHRGGELRAGPFGIAVPVAGRPVGQDVDLAVVPGLAFDRAGGRLGSGMGYYDRWLPAHPAVWTIGFCHAFQLVGNVPGEGHDIAMRAVLTPAGYRVVRLDTAGAVQ